MIRVISFVALGLLVVVGADIAYRMASPTLANKSGSPRDDKTPTDTDQGDTEPKPGDPKFLVGIWRLAIVGGDMETTIVVLHIRADDDKLTAKVVAGLEPFSMKNIVRDGNLVRITLNQKGKLEAEFEANLPSGKATKIPGNIAIDGKILPTMLISTGVNEYNPKSPTLPFDCKPFNDARESIGNSFKSKFEAEQEKDPAKRAQMLKASDDFALIGYRNFKEVLEKHRDSPAVFSSVFGLMKGTKLMRSTVEDATEWAKVGAVSARAYGKRWEREYPQIVASSLLDQPGMEKVVIEYGRKAASAIADNRPPKDHVRILAPLTRALQKEGLTDEAVQYGTRLEKFEQMLDSEYSMFMPGFKGTPFKGRKSKSDRVVLFEQFSGTTCPPCVAADLAFDVLNKTYNPTELALVHYHIHIPGPDPLTNPDTEARWGYYQAHYKEKFISNPANLFNGKNIGGGGGFKPDEAPKKYDQWRAMIDPLLEEKSQASLSASARRNGDKVDIVVKVADLTKPGPKTKLRIILAEQKVRCEGPNRIRLHYNVARAFPGGTEGKSLPEKTAEHQVSVDLVELRKNLDKYLDEVASKGRGFGGPTPPIVLDNLRVIAFVQDDDTREVLQAVQIDVKK